MSDTSSFTKMVPGFDFLQGLVKNAGSALPSMGQWVAPTLDPDELQKRIDELKTVQFWLEQNGKMLATTIQALEVQRMTLSTLKTMNVQMADLRDSMKLPTGAAAASAKPTATSATQPAAKAPAAAPMANPFDADALMNAARNAMSTLGGLGKSAATPAQEAEPEPAPAPEPAALAEPESKASTSEEENTRGR
jgi:hypothetical protein